MDYCQLCQFRYLVFSLQEISENFSCGPLGHEVDGGVASKTNLDDLKMLLKPALFIKYREEVMKQLQIFAVGKFCLGGGS